MTKLISDIHQKMAASASKMHAAVKSHVLTVVYLVVLAAIIIPLGTHIWGYWKPVVAAYAPSFDAPKAKGRM